LILPFIPAKEPFIRKIGPLGRYVGAIRSFGVIDKHGFAVSKVRPATFLPATGPISLDNPKRRVHKIKAFEFFRISCNLKSRPSFMGMYGKTTLFPSGKDVSIVNFADFFGSLNIGKESNNYYLPVTKGGTK
jgi:hypothetical protein